MNIEVTGGNIIKSTTNNINFGKAYDEASKIVTTAITIFKSIVLMTLPDDVDRGSVIKSDIIDLDSLAHQYLSATDNNGKDAVIVALATGVSSIINVVKIEKYANCLKANLSKYHLY